MFGGITNVFKGISSIFGGAGGAGGVGGAGNVLGNVLGGVLGGSKGAQNPLLSAFESVTELFNKGPIQEGQAANPAAMQQAALMSQSQSQNPLLAVVDKLISLVTTLVSSLLGAVGLGGAAQNAQQPGGTASQAPAAFSAQIDDNSVRF